jgi:hypothetical protein
VGQRAERRAVIVSYVPPRYVLAMALVVSSLESAFDSDEREDARRLPAEADGVRGLAPKRGAELVPAPVFRRSFRMASTTSGIGFAALRTAFCGTRPS